MTDDESDWKDLALEIYRDAQAELLGRQGQFFEDQFIEYLIEDLREALLDLKQAVIADRLVDAAESSREIGLFLYELRERLEGDA